MNFGSSSSRSALSGPLATATQGIQLYLDDPLVIEIMLNPDGSLWVDRAGEGQRLTDTRLSPMEAETFLRYVATESKTTLTLEKPTCSGTLPYWGARVQGWIPPAVVCPAFNIRKRSPLILSLDDYLSKGVITEGQKQALVRAVLDRKNILVGGGAGTGKTTFTNALLQVVAAQTNDRIYIIEDTPEIRCDARNKLCVQTVRGAYDANAAVFDALRARPDRIIVGELRDGTAHELLKSWNTGHAGGVATLHADDTRGMLDRMCDLIEEAIPHAQRKNVAAAIHICVHLTLDLAAPAGRRLSGLDRVVGYDRSADQWLLEPLIRARPRGHAST